MSLVVNSNPGFAALLINVSEMQGIEVVNVKNGSVMATMTSGRNILWDSVSNSSSTGTLVELTFRITNSAKAGEYIINVSALECFNDSADDVTVVIDPIVINVIEKSEQNTTEEDDVDEVSTTGEDDVTSEEDVTNEKELTTVPDKSDDNNSGCKSVIATGIWAIILVPIAVFFIKRKDN